MNSKSYLPYMFAGGAGAVVASLPPLLISPSNAQTKLLPFQGRLTDAAGTAIGDGAKVVEFKMYDAPTGGAVKWAGEVHKLSVNGGLVNTLLGSKASLGSVDFSTPTYLQISVDAQADGQEGNGSITPADPPLLPRQSVVPAVFAMESGNSRKLNNADWSSILTGGSNDPVGGTLRGDKLEAGSVNTAQLATGAVKAGQLDANAVSSSKIENGTIQPEDLSTGLQRGIIPTGTVVAFAGDAFVAPPGWQFCDGRSVLKDDPDYSALSGVIGTVHGSDDSTRFNLPDYRGRFLRGVDDADGPGGLVTAGRDPNVTGRTKLGTGKAEGVGSVQDDAFKSHTHDYTDFTVRGNTAADVNAGDNYGRSSPTLTTAATGGSETRPKNAYVNYIIKL